MTGADQAETNSAPLDRIGHLLYPFPFDPPSKTLDIFFLLASPLLVVSFGSEIAIRAMPIPVILAGFLAMTSPTPDVRRPYLAIYRPAFSALAGTAAAAFFAGATSLSGVLPPTELSVYAVFSLLALPAAWSFLAACWRVHLSLIKVLHRAIYAPFIAWITLAAPIAYSINFRAIDGTVKFHATRIDADIGLAMIGVIATFLVAAVVQLQVITRPKKKLRKQRNTAMLIGSTLVGLFGIACAIGAVQARGDQWTLNALYLAAVPTILIVMMSAQLASIQKMN